MAQALKNGNGNENGQRNGRGDDTKKELEDEAILFAEMMMLSSLLLQAGLVRMEDMKGEVWMSILRAAKEEGGVEDDELVEEEVCEDGGKS